jgi:hypothetical protein
MKKKASMKSFYISFLDLMPYSDSHSKKVFSEKSALDAAEEVKSSKVILVRTAGTSLRTNILSYSPLSGIFPCK